MKKVTQTLAVREAGIVTAFPPEIVEAFKALQLRAKPMTKDQYRKHVFETYISESLDNWRFDKRFHSRIILSSAQRRVFALTVARMSNCGAIVALVGKRGVGKTTIAAQFAQEKAWENYDNRMKEGREPRKFEIVMYCKAQRLVAKFKTLYSEAGSIHTEDLIEKLEGLISTNDYLVIDELAECDDMRIAKRLVTDICDRRYSKHLDTILISNQTKPEFQQTTSSSILSRLSEHGAIFECSWKSFREKSNL